MRHFFLGILLMVLCQISCRGNKQHNSDEKSFSQKQIEQKGMSQSSFPFPEIPATLTEPEARKAFLLTHYWDQFSFADTTLVNNRDVTEQGFVNFIALLADGTTPEELTRESLESWCAGFVGKDHARKVLTQTADDPNGGRLPLQPQLAFLQRRALRDVSGGVAWQVATDGRNALRLPFQTGAGKA